MAKKKSYSVLVSITVAANIEVKADSEEQAEAIVKNWIDDDPYYYAGAADEFIESVVVETNEE